MSSKNDFELRHKKYNEFLRAETKKVSRSVMWASISDEFLTEISEGKPVMDTLRKKFYFVEFKKDRGVSFLNKISLFICKSLIRASEIFYSKYINNDLKVSHVFNGLGFYNKKLKYWLEEHPLFGKERCTHNNNLLLQWAYYAALYPYIENIKSLKVLEIGAGAGILTTLMHYDLGAKVVIVDLPEMISYSSACIYQALPEVRMLFPNEVAEKGIHYDDYDFIFLLPEQAKLLKEDYFDLAQNYCSMCEMRHEDIQYYFEIIQRVVKNGGYFYCCNRFKKDTANMGVGDNLVREFFKYPWHKNNVDEFIDIDRLKFEYTNHSYVHLTVNRLQKIVK